MAKSPAQNSFFKIRHRQTGLYSTGGAHPTWRKTGKVWNNLGSLRAHLSQHLGNHRRPSTDMSQWVVVEHQYQVLGNYPIHEILNNNQMIKLLTM